MVSVYRPSVPSVVQGTGAPWAVKSWMVYIRSTQGVLELHVSDIRGADHNNTGRLVRRCPNPCGSRRLQAYKLFHCLVKLKGPCSSFSFSFCLFLYFSFSFSFSFPFFVFPFLFLYFLFSALPSYIFNQSTFPPFSSAPPYSYLSALNLTTYC